MPHKAQSPKPEMVISGCYSFNYSVLALRAGSISLPEFLSNRKQHLLLCLDEQDVSGFVSFSEVLSQPESNQATKDALSHLHQHNTSLRNTCSAQSALLPSAKLLQTPGAGLLEARVEAEAAF